MAQYCDSANLERNWFLWILASRVPSLEYIRDCGLLWTKVVGDVRDSSGKPIYRHGKILTDPNWPIRHHAIATAKPVFFISQAGQIVDPLPDAQQLTLESDSELHNLWGDRFQQYDEVVPNLILDGYIQEVPVQQTWHFMLEDMSKMCSGIASKFNFNNPEEQLDLANDAFVQVIGKLTRHKLNYTPGRAPVFNLLTTTIYRCMFSILTKKKSHRRIVSKILEEAKVGALSPHRRSLRIHT